MSQLFSKSFINIIISSLLNQAFNDFRDSINSLKIKKRRRAIINAKRKDLRN